MESLHESKEQFVRSKQGVGTEQRHSEDSPRWQSGLSSLIIRYWWTIVSYFNNLSEERAFDVAKVG